MNPPIVTELTTPSSHRIRSITAIVYNMIVTFPFEFVRGLSSYPMPNSSKTPASKAEVENCKALDHLY